MNGAGVGFAHKFTSNFFIMVKLFVGDTINHTAREIQPKILRFNGIIIREIDPKFSHFKADTPMERA